MTTLNDIRIAIADRPDDARDLMLPPQEARVLNVVRHSKRPQCSRDIAKRFDLSAQHACMVMDKLYRKGYVDRSQVPQESGGYEYEYLSQID